MACDISVPNIVNVVFFTLIKVRRNSGELLRICHFWSVKVTSPESVGGLVEDHNFTLIVLPASLSSRVPIFLHDRRSTSLFPFWSWPLESWTRVFSTIADEPRKYLDQLIWWVLAGTGQSGCWLDVIAFTVINCCGAHVFWRVKGERGGRWEGTFNISLLCSILLESLQRTALFFAPTPVSAFHLEISPTNKLFKGKFWKDLYINITIG